MSSHCPFCGFLVALDEAGQPLSRCPNCAQRLRDDDPVSGAAAAPGENAATPAIAAAGRTSGSGLPAPLAASDPTPAPEPPHSDVRTTDADAKRASDGPASSPSATAGNPGASPRPDTKATAIVGEAPSARPDAAPQTSRPHAIASTAQPAPAVSASNHQVPAGDAPAGAVDADTADVDHAPLPTPPQTVPPDAALTTDALPAAVDARRTQPAEAGETGRASPAFPGREPDAEPPSVTAPEPDAPSAVASDAASAAPADDSHSATATEHSEVVAGKRTTPPQSAAVLAAEPGERAAPGPSSGDGPVDPARDEGETTTATTPTAPTSQAADATAEAAPAAPPKPIRRGPGAPAAPSFARARVSAAAVGRRRLALRGVAIAVLSALLILQLLLSDRARLAGDPRWRPLLTQLCGVLQCTLPAWREPRAFRVIERDISLRAPGVLRVSARIRNDARWSQPWPRLQLTLSDANGRDVATRLFTPVEYLGGAPTQSELGSGQSAALSMDIVEPGPQAVAFTFDFQ